MFNWFWRRVILQQEASSPEGCIIVLEKKTWISSEERNGGKEVNNQEK